MTQTLLSSSASERAAAPSTRAIPRSPPGSLSNIVIRNMTVKSAHRVAVLISGIPAHPIEDVTLHNIAIALAGDPVTHLPTDPPETPAAYPEVRMFGPDLPAFGIYARHIRRLTTAAVKITPVPGDIRPERTVLEESGTIEPT